MGGARHQAGPVTAGTPLRPRDEGPEPGPRLASCPEIRGVAQRGYARGVKHVAPLARRGGWLSSGSGSCSSGEWNRQEQVGGRRDRGDDRRKSSPSSRARARASPRACRCAALADVPRALGMVVVDFGIIVWALLASVARRRVVRGGLVSREARARTPPPPAASVRGPGRAPALRYSPNAYVDRRRSGDAAPSSSTTSCRTAARRDRCERVPHRRDGAHRGARSAARGGFGAAPDRRARRGRGRRGRVHARAALPLRRSRQLHLLHRGR